MSPRPRSGVGRLVVAVPLAAVMVTWLFSAPPAAADRAQRFVNRPGTELTAADGTPLGTLRVGTAVEMVRDEGDTVEVVLHGWSWATGPGLVFVGLGERIAVAALADAGQAVRAADDPVDDAFGVPWQAVSVRGVVSELDLSVDTSDIWASAAHVMDAKCSTCHSVPAASKYPVYRWPDRVNSCAGRGRANLRPAELELVVQYLQYQTERR
jgi:hypothetical protein